MSSLTRSMQRQIIRSRAEAEAAPKRTKLRAKRKRPTDALDLERNVILFKKAWSDYHYPSVTVTDKDGNVSTVKKRKPIKKKRYFPCAALMPKLLPPANPKFSFERMTFT